jgi:hypothetical protein
MTIKGKTYIMQLLIIFTILASEVVGNVHENLAETKQREMKNNDPFVKSPITHTIFTVLEVFMIVLLLVLVFLFIVRVSTTMKIVLIKLVS